MQVQFDDHFLGEVASKKGYTGKLPFPAEVVTKFKQRIFQIKNALNTQELRNIKSLHFEKLKEKKYEGKYSIRINQAYRIIFRVIDNEGGKIEIICIEEISQTITHKRLITGVCMIIDQVLDHEGNVIEVEAFHPGQFLQEEIEERGLVKKEVAKSLDILPNHLSDIFAGKRNISAKLVLKLEKLLGISAQYWLGMQMEYDLYVAKKSEQLV